MKKSTLQSNTTQSKRIVIRIIGIVQGVGFRPFVKNLADELRVCGSVCNKGPYVEIAAESGECGLAAFLQALRVRAPARAQIRRIETREEEPQGLSGFVILESGFESGEAYVPPDIAVCDDCRRELFDPQNRRYLHPFINCTACGPRLTILDAMPYDRERTSMKGFALCGDCRGEYTAPRNRRYHAQPVCCSRCGPRLHVLKGEGEDGGRDPIAAARAVLRGGGIVAVKGVGGFHLCCDAASSHAVALLRKRKSRPSRPFAVLVRDFETALRESECPPENRAAAHALLTGPEKPIVLLPKRKGGRICPECAPGIPRIGLMLPYAPVQLLLFSYPDGLPFTDCLVMTSANAPGAPICINDEQALAQLSGFCDFILSNDRPIRLRADDSVAAVFAGKPLLLRRSRGYAPLPFSTHRFAEKGIFAAGGELKNAFCLSTGGRHILSPHVGDLSDERGLQALDAARRSLSRLHGITPAYAVCDLHPGYLSSAYAKGLGLPVLQVQHHFAHAAACMAENGLGGEAIGVTFDGTGYGTDGTVWGGEFLKVSYRGFERLGHLEPFLLAGGDKASAECYRPAVSLLLQAFESADEARETALALGLCDENRFAALQFQMKTGVNAVPCTSAGRLFDAVSAILGVRRVSTYEGEAAVRLEAAADPALLTEAPGVEITPQTQTAPFVIPVRNVVKYMALKRLAGEPAAALAAQFHTAAADMVRAGCIAARGRTGLSRVVLSGGCFQNLLLLSLCVRGLAHAGFTVYTHSLVPPGDGGLALGQAAVAVEHFFKD